MSTPDDTVGVPAWRPVNPDPDCWPDTCWEWLKEATYNWHTCGFDQEKLAQWLATPWVQASCVAAWTTKARPNHCFLNAVEALDFAAERRRKRKQEPGQYVEGFVVTVSGRRISVIEHGWFERQASGLLIDPTLPFILSDELPVYFPGPRWTWRELPNEVDLPLNRSILRPRGLRHPQMKQAFTQANEYAATCPYRFSDRLARRVRVGRARNSDC